MPRILIVEDEAAIADTLVYALGLDGHQVEHLALGEAALARLRDTPFDLAILDVGLPDANGFDLCRRLRAFSDLPVIFLTARSDEIDRVVGLEIGADDYITKPFSPREVAARVRVILRRLQRGNGHAETVAETPPPAPAAPLRAIGPFQLDEAGARIHYHGQPLDLTRYEYLLLKTLLLQPARVYSRAQLMDAAWVAPDHAMERTVDTHVKTLRAKLRAVCEQEDPIRTHRGLGYSLSLRGQG